MLERIEVAGCRHLGASVELVQLKRQRRRPISVWTHKGDRTPAFWRSQHAMRAARPGVRVPLARGLGGPLTIVIDEREPYACRFANLPITTERRALPVGDYAVFAGRAERSRPMAVVERKRTHELAADAVAGKLALTLSEFVAQPRAVVMVGGRLSQVPKPDMDVRKARLLNLVAGLQAAYPNAPFLLAETLKLAADLAYRWLAAASRLAHAATEAHRSATPSLRTRRPPHGRARRSGRPTRPRSRRCSHPRPGARARRR